MKTRPNVYRLSARIVMHLNGGFTRLDVPQIHDCVEVQTEIIPPDLRRIGSEFVLVRQVDSDGIVDRVDRSASN